MKHPRSIRSIPQPGVKGGMPCLGFVSRSLPRGVLCVFHLDGMQPESKLGMPGKLGRSGWGMSGSVPRCTACTGVEEGLRDGAVLEARSYKS
jgi:hypothetical protein